MHVMEYLEEERDRILEWLYAGAFDTKHREISNRRQKNTAQWIIVSPEVTSWMNNPSGSRLLWGYGIRKFRLFWCYYLYNNILNVYSF
jgi:hypothetical protein